MVNIYDLARGASFWKLLGIELVDNGKEVMLRLPVKDELLQFYGKVHGGVMATLIDAAGGVALNQNLPPEKGAATVEMKVNYLRSVEKGTLYAKGEVVHLGRTLAVVNANVWNEQGQKVAYGVGTYYLHEINS